MKEKLKELAAGLGVSLSDEQLAQFEAYTTLLQEKNAVMNLVGDASEEALLNRHFLDCIALVPYIRECFGEEFSFVDVGSGAGFPGIPLAICFPKARVCLLDALSKRINFLAECVEKLNLSEVTLLWGRSEEQAHRPELRESFDFAIARAVARLGALDEYLCGFVRVGGAILAMKGPQAAEEVAEAARSAKKLGLSEVEIIPIAVSEDAAGHCLVVYKKEKELAKKYPRAQAQIKKGGA